MSVSRCRFFSGRGGTGTDDVHRTIGTERLQPAWAAQPLPNENLLSSSRTGSNFMPSVFACRGRCSSGLCFDTVSEFPQRERMVLQLSYSGNVDSSRPRTDPNFYKINCTTIGQLSISDYFSADVIRSNHDRTTSRWPQKSERRGQSTDESSLRPRSDGTDCTDGVRERRHEQRTGVVARNRHCRGED